MLFGRQHILVDHNEGTWDQAYEFAVALDEDSRKHNRKNNFNIHEKENTPEENFRKTLQGALAECAVHVVTNLPWHRTVGNVGNKKTLPDIGDDIQVRSRRSGKDLIHRETDDPNQKFVLVWVNIDDRISTVVGWLYGWQCREKGEWKDPQNRNSPVWEVSHMRLNSMDTIQKG